MQLALCEDSIADQGQIEECFCAVGKALDMNICVDSYTRAEDLLKKIETGYRYDAYILDIFMEKMDGITLTKEIRKRDREAKIAFIPSSREFAVEAFEIRAIHYLLKPVTEGHVRELLERLTIAEKKTEPVFTGRYRYD